MMDEPPLLDLARADDDGGAVLSEEDVIREGRASMLAFLRSQTCYDVVKDSSKVVVLDVQIAVKLAFFVLVEHSVVAAPLWNSETAQFVGLMTVSDFLHVFLASYEPAGAPGSGVAGSGSTDDLSSHTVVSWKACPASVPPPVPPQHCPTGTPAAVVAAAADPAQAGDYDAAAVVAAAAAAAAAGGGAAAAAAAMGAPGCLSLSPNDSLYDAVLLLRARRTLHQVPLIDAEARSVLSVLNYRLLLDYLVANYKEQRKLFDQPLVSLGIGTHRSTGGVLLTALLDTPLGAVFRTLADHGLAALPLVDESGAVVSVYSRNDVTLLGKISSTQLSTPVGAVVRQQQEMGLYAEQLTLCPEQMTLHSAFELLSADQKAFHLVCVDAEQRPTGIVALCDIFEYFLREES